MFSEQVGGDVLDTVFTPADLLVGHTQGIAGVAIAIAGLIAEFVSFRALFFTIGMIGPAATLVQRRLSWLEEHAPV